MSIESAEDRPGDTRRLTARQEDGRVYKAMAFVVFAIVVLPFGYALTHRFNAESNVLLLLGLLVFDAGWDLAMRATGRSDMLGVATPRAILARALDRSVMVGLVLLFFSLEGDLRLLLGAVFVAWITSEVLSGARRR